MIKNFTMTSLYNFHIVYYCLENKSQPKKFKKYELYNILKIQITDKFFFDLIILVNCPNLGYYLFQSKIQFS